MTGKLEVLLVTHDHGAISMDESLVNRIGSSDRTVKLYSLSLINSLWRNVSEDLLESFTSEREKRIKVSGGAKKQGEHGSPQQ